MGIEQTNASILFVSGSVAKPGTGGFAIIGPRDSGATVAANVVNAYRSADAVENDHAAGSALATSAVYAQANISRFYAASFSDGANAAAGDRTFQTQTGTLPATETGIYSLTSATIDGVAVSRIVYTEGNPASETYDDAINGEIHFNPKTRAFKTSRTPSGSGAGTILTYKRADLTPLFDQIAMRPIEVITFAGDWRFTPQYLAVYTDLIAFAEANRMMVYTAVADSSDPTDASFQALTATTRSNSFQTIAAKQASGTTADELGVAYAALQAKSPVNGTLKAQPAPRGITFDRVLPYTRSEYGDDVDPNTGTFHYLGVNAISLSNDGGTFIITSDRAMTDYSVSTDVLFGGVQRTANATVALAVFRVNSVLANPKAGAKFDQPGLEAVRKAFEAGLTEAVSLRYIDPEYVLNMPTSIDETEETDRKKRLLAGVTIEARVINPIQTVDATIEVSQ